MFNTLLLATQLVCPPQHYHQPYPIYQPYYYNPYVTRWPTPDSLKPPAFTTQPANVPSRKTPAASVQVAPSVYGGGGGPLIIENPYYKPSK